MATRARGCHAIPPAGPSCSGEPGRPGLQPSLCASAQGKALLCHHPLPDLSPQYPSFVGKWICLCKQSPETGKPLAPGTRSQGVQKRWGGGREEDRRMKKGERSKMSVAKRRGRFSAPACSPAERKAHVRFALRVYGGGFCQPRLQGKTSRNPAEFTQKHVPRGPRGTSPSGSRVLQVCLGQTCPCLRTGSSHQHHGCPQSWGGWKAAARPGPGRGRGTGAL